MGPSYIEDGMRGVSKFRVNGQAQEKKRFSSEVQSTYVEDEGCYR